MNNNFTSTTPTSTVHTLAEHGRPDDSIELRVEPDGSGYLVLRGPFIGSLSPERQEEVGASVLAAFMSRLHSPTRDDQGNADPRVLGVVAAVGVSLAALLLPVVITVPVVAAGLLATVALLARGDSRARATDGLTPAAVAWNERAAVLQAAEEPEPARLDPVCESCRRRPAEALVRVDGQVFRICRECTPSPSAVAS